jgi:hypothetical protein
MSQVVQLVTKPKAKPQVARSHRAASAVRRQTKVAVGAGLVAATLTALSLSHLAHGIELLTSCPTWEAWAMAIGIDLGFITLELLMITAVTEAVRRKIARHANPAIIGTLLGSAGMNALAFANAAAGWMIWPAAAVGAVIPALIYLVMRAATTAYLSRA